MKTLYKANLIMTSSLLLISLTFWGAIISLPVLGFIQILMSIAIFRNRKILQKMTLKFFQAYVVITLLLIILFRVFYVFNVIETIVLFIIWMFISAFLALFHLYITSRIKVEYEKMNYENSNS